MCWVTLRMKQTRVSLCISCILNIDVAGIGTKAGHPKMGHSGMKLILSWKQLRPYRFKTNFCLSLNYIEESKVKGLSRIRVITKINFYLSDPSVGQCKQLIGKHLLFLSPCEFHSFPLKSRTPTPFSSVQNDTYTSSCLSGISVSVGITHR